MGFAYLPSPSGGTVAVMSLVSNTVVDTIPAANNGVIAVDPAHDSVYLGGPNAITNIDAKTILSCSKRGR